MRIHPIDILVASQLGFVEITVTTIDGINESAITIVDNLPLGGITRFYIDLKQNNGSYRIVVADAFQTAVLSN